MSHGVRLLRSTLQCTLKKLVPHPKDDLHCFHALLLFHLLETWIEVSGGMPLSSLKSNKWIIVNVIKRQKKTSTRFWRLRPFTRIKNLTTFGFVFSGGIAAIKSDLDNPNDNTSNWLLLRLLITWVNVWALLRCLFKLFADSENLDFKFGISHVSESVSENPSI